MKGIRKVKGWIPKRPDPKRRRRMRDASWGLHGIAGRPGKLRESWSLSSELKEKESIDKVEIIIYN